LEDVEAALRGAFDHVEIDTHLEPLEDPRSYEPDLADRVDEAAAQRNLDV
jgi:hypothetical protein